jgi:hypothetical protein
VTGARCRAILALTLGCVVAAGGLVGCADKQPQHREVTAVTRAPGQPIPPGRTLADAAGLEPVQAWFAAGQGTPRLVLALSPT